MGTSIIFTANATGGIPPYQYKWWVFDGIRWTSVRDWATSNTFTWTPALPNSGYFVGVWVRNASTTTDTSDAGRSLAFSISSPPPPTLDALIADKSAPQLIGSSVTFTGNASGGQPPYQYKWWVFDGTRWNLVRDWSTSNAFTWTPTLANPGYLVGLWVRNASATTDTSDAGRSLAFPISSPPPLIVNALTADRAAPLLVGSSTTFTASASGGQPPYQYKWWVFDGIGWTSVRDWSMSNAFTWTPTLANPSYFVGVWVRNASTTTDTSDAGRSLAFPISPAP